MSQPSWFLSSPVTSLRTERGTPSRLPWQRLNALLYISKLYTVLSFIVYSFCLCCTVVLQSVCVWCSGAVQTRQAALPPDASCEDLQIDVSLPFLNSFVQQALDHGAAPYISQQQRTSMGVMPTSRHHEAAEQPHALRFAAYEKAQAPGSAQPLHNLLDGSHQQAASQQSSSRSSSPVKGKKPSKDPNDHAEVMYTPLCMCYLSFC